MMNLTNSKSKSRLLLPPSQLIKLGTDKAFLKPRIPYLNSLALLSTQFFYQPITNTYLPYTPFLPSSPALVIDYLPLYRHLTAVDDERERIAEETGQGFGDGGVSGRGAGVRRSTRTTTTAGGGGGGIEVKGKRIKISKLIEWRAKEDVEFVRSNGFFHP